MIRTSNHLRRRPSHPPQTQPLHSVIPSLSLLWVLPCLLRSIFPPKNPSTPPCRPFGTANPRRAKLVVRDFTIHIVAPGAKPCLQSGSRLEAGEVVRHMGCEKVGGGIGRRSVGKDRIS
eukprot:346555-Amorphochlora_amoeboformis.AAC.1